MSKEIEQSIIDIANEVIAQYKICHPITNIDDIVAHMGGTVRRDPFQRQLSSGCIEVHEEGKFTITIPTTSHLAATSEYFLIAHELGHLFLHESANQDSGFWCNYLIPTTNTDEIDRNIEADIFAAAFLMPDCVFHDVCTRHIEGSRVNISKVADEFRVTDSDASYRAKLLGYTFL